MTDRNPSNEGRKLWKSARERERMRARFAIRERVSSLSSTSIVDRHDDNPDNEEANAQEDETTCRITNQCEFPDLLILENQPSEQLVQIQNMLRQVEAGCASAFSLSTLAKYHTLLSRPIPTTYLSIYKITTLCTSRFGNAYAERLLLYVNDLATCSILEYAAWLGEYKILGSFLSGGFDPTLRGEEKFQNRHQHPPGQQQILLHDTQGRRALAARILKRFFDAFPTSLSCYISHRVVQMRIQDWEQRKGNLPNEPVCPLCQGDNQNSLNFGSPCHHGFCECCLWEDILSNVDNRSEGDVVVCPICGETGECTDNSRQDANNYSMLGNSPEERCQQSLEKYQMLPKTSIELKKFPKKKKHSNHAALTSSWSEAVMRSLGSSQDVRRDKFFNHGERNAFHYVKGCLVAGIDVNLTNEYGQTVLYIAAWRGYFELVTLLLEFGANVNIHSNGGLSALCASEANGHFNVVQLLKSSLAAPDECIGNNVAVPNRNDYLPSTCITLIDSLSDHPGAGSFLIDHCLPSHTVDALIDLWQRLPVDTCDKKKKGQQQQSVLCSVRSYYCDAEGNLRRALCDAICHAGVTSGSTQSVVVFPHMRFLHYAHPGGVLAPHVDLCRVDLSGQRSTHTFILYLYDCVSGGETRLLGDVSGDGRNECLARVSPRRGRLLLFPHACPHEGNEVQDVPKVLVRGEVWLTPSCRN